MCKERFVRAFVASTVCTHVRLIVWLGGVGHLKLSRSFISLQFDIYSWTPSFTIHSLGQRANRDMS